MTSEPVGLSNNLAPQQVMRAIIGRHDIAVWRSVSGVVNAWENRCPHRGMRLSHGFVRGESLACAYHGWHYNTDGYCHYIPAHPELTPPKTVRPVAHSVVEEAGLIWVNPQHEANPAASLPEDAVPIRSLGFDCDTDCIMAVLSSDDDIDSAMDTLCDSPRLITLAAGQLANGFIVAFQQPRAGRVIAHLLARDGVARDQRIALSRKFESVRRRAEHNFKTL